MISSNNSRVPIVTSNLIRYRLPRGIVTLLLVAVAIVTGAAYLFLTKSLVEVAGKRARSASIRLAATLTESARQLRLDEGRVAADTNVRQAVVAGAGPAGDAARTAAKAFLTPRLSRSIGIRLVDGTGRSVLDLGKWPNRVAAPAGVLGSATDTTADFRVSSFQSAGDSLYYVTSSSIRVGNVGVGALEEARLISGPGAAKIFSDLIGSDASLLVGDRSGAWTNLETSVPGPILATSDSGIARYRAPDGTDWIGAGAPVARTPWIAWVQFPARSILAPARRFFLLMAAVAFLVVVAGGIGGWLFSRRIAVPLEEVSRAAEGIATGDLTRRVTSQGTDELGRLAASFNSMARQVEDGHRDLEARVSERTGELEEALAELSAAQEELVRKERLATLGQLAGSVGHELRNPLGVMTNSLYLLSMVAPDDPPLLREYLDIIKGQVLLSEKIVSDLLDFARVKQPSSESFALSSLVAEQLARTGDVGNVTVSCDDGANVPLAVGDRIQVGQIVLNLLTNAVQAVGDTAGTVVVRCHVDGPERLRLDVTDTGCGIPEANIERVFDPLFTTKARGIGLGLSVSRQLARVNGGDIDVTSTVGVGSTFSLYLPAAKQAAA